MPSHAHRVTTQSAKSSASSSDNWRTPQEVFDCVRKYAPIGLDPCTDETNPAGAREWFTPLMDRVAAKLPWKTSWDVTLHGNECVWTNPPFSSKIEWMRSAVRASESVPVFVLCRVSHTAKWWRQLMMPAADVVIYWNKRLRFIDPDGRAMVQAPFDTAIFGLNVSPKRVREAFGGVARIEVVG